MDVNKESTVTPSKESATNKQVHDSAKVQGSLDMEEKAMDKVAEELETGTRRKITTDKGKEYEFQRLKDNRASALSHVTRHMNKIRPLLVDLNNQEFVSHEMEGLNSLINKLQEAHGKYLNSLKDESEIDNANVWYDVHDSDILKFKQTVCDYISKSRQQQLIEVRSIASNVSCRSSRKSIRSKRFISSSTSSKSRLLEAKTKVASLEIKAAFLKEKQALKMAAEELQLKENLAQAKEEEKIFEQLNKEELSSTPISAPSGLPHLPISNLLPRYILNLNEESPDNYL